MELTSLKSCRLCPRKCEVNRLSGQLGYCKASSTTRIFRYGPHFGEEPPLSGERGSGTIFFSHCTLSCLFCQNYPWSQQHRGEDAQVDQLSRIFEELYNLKCHNWNLVSPTPWLPFIEKATQNPLLRDKRLPFVYNTSGFESLETLDRYSALMDIALTDLRYSRPETALQASGSADYVQVARDALLWFCDKLGILETDDDGIATRGVICRLLVLPGLPDQAVENLRWIARNIGTQLYISIMSQYTPAYRAVGNGQWGRKIAEDEYRLVTDEAEHLGFENGWIQPYEMVDDDGLPGYEMSAGMGFVGHKQ